MKRLPVVILVMLVLGAVVSGCDSTRRYDSRLTAADSLMRSAPDSALTIVDAISRYSLADEGDRAYRDLLLTQARYRCYITATSDSDINRALAWYRVHPADREKLTRAYIYKGAVMEELGHPDSAMLYYKTAETTAAPDDYFNLGYISMRMGALYRDFYSMDGKHIEKYEQALQYLKYTDNTYYQLRCMINLGSLYCLKSPQKSDTILIEALSLAQRIGDTASIVAAAQNIIKNQINQQNYTEAQKLVWLVSNLNTDKIDAAFYIYAAHEYARLKMTDSAEFFLKQVRVTSTMSQINRISYYQSLAEIALSRGDTLLYAQTMKEARQKEDSLLATNKSFSLMQMEENKNKELQDKALSLQRKRFFWLFLLFSGLVLGLSLVASIKTYKKNSVLKMRIKQFRQDTDKQHQELNVLQNNLNDLNIKDEKLNEFIASLLELLNDVLEECQGQKRTNESLVARIKNIVNFKNGNNEKWKSLFDYLDIKYNNIISKTRSNYPQLNEKELMLIALTALDFSCLQTTVILGYYNPTSVGPISQRLIKKMNWQGSLKDYVGLFK